MLNDSNYRSIYDYIYMLNDASLNGFVINPPVKYLVNLFAIGLTASPMAIVDYEAMETIVRLRV